MKKSPYLAGLFLGLYFGITSLAAETPKTILVWGDSLSAAYGMPIEKSWVSLLGTRISNKGYRVVNGSVSGETTRGGLARLPAALEQHQPDIVILELGANDGLRGISITEIQNNLLSMTEQAKKSGADVLLLGMQMPPNYGSIYTQQFSNVYLGIVEKTEVAFVPFFLDKVATDFDLMRADGIHPTAKAQPRLLDNIWPALQSLL